MLGKRDPLGTAAHIYKGYTAEMKLTDEEKAVLPCLIASRLVQVLCETRLMLLPCLGDASLDLAWSGDGAALPFPHWAD
jgi:hypothetical protein